MPGKPFLGLLTTPPDHAYAPNVAKAYCEGRGAGLAGGVAGDNPHALGSESREAWANGFVNFANALGRQGCAT